MTFFAGGVVFIGFSRGWASRDRSFMGSEGAFFALSWLFSGSRCGQLVLIVWFFQGCRGVTIFMVWLRGFSGFPGVGGLLGLLSTMGSTWGA